MPSSPTDPGAAEPTADDGRARSREYARQAMADPEFRAFLEASIERVRHSDAPCISKAEFLARTADIDESPGLTAEP